jgi:deoxyribodipyrimidine photolyase
VLNLVDVRQHALTLASPTQAESFIQELTWREYWRRVLWGVGQPHLGGSRAIQDGL